MVLNLMHPVGTAFSANLCFHVSMLCQAASSFTFNIELVGKYLSVTLLDQSKRQLGVRQLLCLLLYLINILRISEKRVGLNMHLELLNIIESVP